MKPCVYLSASPLRLLAVSLSFGVKYQRFQAHIVQRSFKETIGQWWLDHLNKEVH